MKANIKHLAKGRIKILFDQAAMCMQADPELAQRYVAIARRVAMAAKVRLPIEYRHQICKYCKSFMLPGVNCRVRLQQLREPHVVMTCLSCGGKTRIMLRKKSGVDKE